VPDEREQQAVKLARRLHRQGHSLRQIAGKLTSAGHTPKDGGYWHPTQVARVLAR
jgi:hypothetical protein